MKMPKQGSLVLMILLVLFIVLVACMFLSEVIGEKTVLSDTAVLPPNGQKVYNVPAGQVTINFTSPTPIDERYEGLGVRGGGHNINQESVGVGSLLGAKYTIINTGNSQANVDVRMTTGVLNPFAYI